MIAIGRTAWVTCLLVPILGRCSPAAEKDRYGDDLPPGAVARLGTIRLGHAGVIQAIAYSPDGKSLVAAAESIRFWDAANGRLIHEMAKRKYDPIRRLAISPDGRTVAFPRSDSVRVMDVATGRQVHDFRAHKWFSECAAFSPDGKILASGGRDDTIRFWDLSTGKQVRTLNSPGNTTYLAYPPGGRTLVSSSRSECRLWDVETGKVLRRWADSREPTALSPNGQFLVTGTKNGRVQLWDVASGKELRQFDLPREGGVIGEDGVIEHVAARCATFSNDGKLLAVGDMTNRVHVWDVATGKELICSPPYPNWVTSLAFSRDAKTLAVAVWHRILLWETTTMKDRLPFGGHANQVGRVAFSPDGKAAVTQSQDALILWDPLTGREREKWSDKTFIAFSPGGDLLLRNKGSVVQWQMDTGKTLRTFKIYEREMAEDIAQITAVFSQDGKAMVTGSRDRTIRLWNPATGKLLWQARRIDKDRRFPADIGGHWPLGFTHDGEAVVSIADDAVVRFWDAATGKEIRWFRIDSSEAALSPDGRFLVAVGKHVAAPDGKSEGRSAAPARLWDLTEKEMRPTELYPKDAGAMAFSPTGRVVALAIGADIVLVERVTGKEIRRLKGHRADVLDLAFAPDGRLLVSGSYDLTALVWKVR